MIKISGLTKNFKDKCAVNNLNLNISRGEIFGFLGPNGAGKTTTIKMITGITQPDKGEILINNIDIHKNPIQAKSIIGYVPDRPYLYELLTAREFFRFIGGIYNIDIKEAEQRGMDFLDRFEMADEGDSLIESFSHGMKQKVIMAASILHNPPVLIIDEPMVGLDPKSANLIKEHFINLARNKKVTLFISTHTLSVVEDICTRVGIIFKGQLIALGDIEQIKDKSALENPSLEKAFLQITMEEYDRKIDVLDMKTESPE
jgi:ABC-2 type transport system ATP-binding protein